MFNLQRIYILEDENGDLLADSLITVDSWRNLCSKLLNIQRCDDFNLSKIRTAEPLGLEWSHNEVENFTEYMKRYK